MDGSNKNGRKGYEFWDGCAPDESKSVVVDVSIPSFATSIRYGFLGMFLVTLVDVSYMISVSVTPKGG